MEDATGKPAKRSTLAVAAMGIVFGDIGTSPLYSIQQIFNGAHHIRPDESRVLGALSLVFWTVTLVVTVKYVLIVMRADNDGEGGIMALASLTTRHRFRSTRTAAVLLGLGVFGAALFYGDSMITPAVSVLSAVEGLQVADPGLQAWVIPIALVVLVALFAVQRFGTGRVGAAFGPIMVVWFVVIAALGLVSILATPGILRSLSPTCAVALFVDEPLIAFLSLSSVVLCVTGAEALYADMGHFGRGPIRISWLGLASWALYLNYLGQGALLLRDPGASGNPFYELVPDPLRIPMVILATLATVIASQAVISGAFSMTEQAVKLRYLPRMTVRHTSARTRGQIYVPFVNWLLLVAVVGLVLGFRSSSNLASAYGLAVSGTFVITTILISVVARTRWRIPLGVLIPVTVLFAVIDLSFLGANLTKFSHGGWFPVLIAVVVLTVLLTWSRGRGLLRRAMENDAMSDEQLIAAFQSDDVTKIPGTAVYLTIDRRPPLALTQYLRLSQAMPEVVVQVSIEAAKIPIVGSADRIRLETPCPGFHRVIAKYGFMQVIDITGDLDAARDRGLVLKPPIAYVVYTSRIEPRGSLGMALWRKHLFAFMSRNAADPSAYFRISHGQVIEYTGVIRI